MTAIGPEGDRGVTVVMPVLNEARTIKACVESLLRQAADFEVRILVVDGGSDDGTIEVILPMCRAHPEIALLANPRRTAAAGLNIGVRAASTSVIARMDGHSIAPPNYLARGLQDLEETGAWAVGGEMRRIGSNPTTDAIATATMSPIGIGNASHNYSRRPMWAETVYLGMWPRWVFERVGLFDEELVRNQDDEFSYRIRAAGGRILFDPAISIAYRPRASIVALFDQYRQYGMWKVRVIQMHPASLRARHLVPMLLVAWIIIGAIASLVSVRVAAWYAVTVIAYPAILFAAALRLRRQPCDAVRVSIAFGALHLGYGIGFWQGLVRFAPRWVRGRAGRPPQLLSLATKADDSA